MKSAQPLPKTVATAILAGLLGVTARQIQKLASEFGMPRCSRNEWDLNICVQWFISYVQGKGQSTSEEIQKERRLLLKAQRQRHELELSVRRGELIDRELVANAMNDMASIFATQLESMPSRLSAELAEISEIEAIKELLVDECRTIRTSTAGAILDSAKQERSRIDRKAATKTKRRTMGRRTQSIAPGIT